MFHDLHDVVTIAVGMVCLFAIVSPKVPTGILPTIGLSIIAVAAFWSMDDWAPAPKVVDVMLAGVGIACVGVIWRAYVKPRSPHMRRSTDWLEQTRPLPRERQPEGEPS